MKKPILIENINHNLYILHKEDSLKNGVKKETPTILIPHIAHVSKKIYTSVIS